MNSAQTVWLAALLPISVLGVACLSRPDALELGRRLFAAGAVSGLLQFVWGLTAAFFSSGSTFGGNWISSGVDEVVGASIVPSIPLVIAGSVCLLGAACRRSTTRATKP